jgi:hypothetical protein
VGQLSPHSPSHRSPCGGVRAVSPLPKWARGILPDICYVFIAVYWIDENIVQWDWLGKHVKYVEAFHCFTVHFNSLSIMIQQMHLCIIKH